MNRYIIERDIPDIGSAEREALRGAAAKSNEVLEQLGAVIRQESRPRRISGSLAAPSKRRGRWYLRVAT